MPITPKEWKDLPSKETPINADSLKDLEVRVTEYTDNASFASGGYYRFVQGMPSDVWTITHNLAKIPSIVVIDSAGSEVEGEITHIDENTATIRFGAAFSGVAYLN